MPPSLRWAKANGRKDLIPKIEKKLAKHGIYIDPDKIELEKKTSIGEHVREFFNRRNIRAIAYIFWIGAAYALTVNLVSVYSSAVLKDDFHVSYAGATFGTFLIDLIGTFGVVLTLILADRVGRRLMGLLGFVLSAIPLIVLLFAYIYHFISVDLVIGMFGLFFFINVGFIGTLQYLPAAEISTTNSRGLAVGWEKLFEFGLALPALVIYAAIGLFNSLIYDIVMVIIGGIILYALSMETGGRSLEENAMNSMSGLKHTAKRTELKEE